MFSCKNNVSKDLNVIEVNFEQKHDIGLFFSSWHPVVLETTDDNILGQINILRLEDDRIYIYSNQTHIISIFNLEGKFINQINKLGQGPEEYLSVSDIQIYNNSIYLLDRTNKKIFNYDFEGNFIKSYQLDDWYNKFTFIDENCIILYSETSNDKLFNYVVYNYVNDIYVDEFDPFKENVSYGFGISPFNQTKDGSLLVTQQFDNTIYSLDAKSYEPLVSFNFETKEHLPPNYKDIPIDELSDMMRNKAIVKRISYVDKKGSNIFAVFTAFFDEYGLRDCISLINLDAKTARTIRLGDESYSDYPFLGGSCLYMTNGYYITSYTAPFVIKKLERNNSLKRGILANINLSEEDNPVLFFHKYNL